MTSSLRERKKQHTRTRISDVATRLFFTQGFETTTIAEVAAAADVAKMTVTNYFPLKEDLVFDRAEAIVRSLAEAVDTRRPGTSATAAVRAAYLDAVHRRDPVLGFVGVEFARLVEASAALRVREREIFAAQEQALAAAVHAADASSAADLRPRLLAARLAGGYRILHGEGRRRLLAGESTDTIARALRRGAAAAFAEPSPAR